MFPLVILLYAWWKRGRIGWRDLMASLPFALVSLVLVKISFGAGHVFGHAQLTTPELLPLGGLLSRIILAGLAIAFYFSISFLPVIL